MSYNSNEDACTVLLIWHFSFYILWKTIDNGDASTLKLRFEIFISSEKVSRFYPDFPFKVWTDHVAQLKKRNVTEQSDVQLDPRKIFLVEKIFFP